MTAEDRGVKKWHDEKAIDSHLSVIWMALAWQRAMLAIEPVFSSGVARSRLADVPLPPVGAIATPVLGVATPVI